MRGTTQRRVLAVFLAVSSGSMTVLAGCSDTPKTPAAVTCVPVLEMAIMLTVRDSITGQPAAMGATVTARQTLPGGGFGADTGQVNDSQGLTVRLGTTAGIYDVTIRKLGYADWTRNGVVVLADSECVPRTVSLTANLQPVAQSPR